MVTNSRIHTAWLIIFFIVQLLMQTHAAGTKNIALVIGNNSYLHAPSLSNPINDAKEISALLKRIGFEVIESYDVNKVKLEQVMDQFSEKVRSAEIGLVYFAGHGIQYEGTTYIVPTDVKLSDNRELRRLIPADYILQDASRASKLGLVILDACRDNPFVKRLSESAGATRSMVVGRGLKRVSDAPSNSLIAYSTQSGNVALDGDTGGHSPYAAALLKNLATKNKDIRLVFGAIRDDVIKMTGRRQEPYTYGSLSGEEIYLFSGSNQSYRNSNNDQKFDHAPRLHTNSAAPIASTYTHWVIGTTDNSWTELTTLSTSSDNSLFPLLARRLLEAKKSHLEQNPSVLIEKLKRSDNNIKLSNHSVKVLQSNLRNLNYYSGLLDGVLNNNTSNALYSFLKDNGLKRSIGFNALLTLALKNGEREAQSNLTGRWAGRYYYPRPLKGVKSVTFEMDLTFSQGNITGFVSEPNTFGNKSSKNLYANFKGSVTGNEVTWVKKYDGTGGVSHSVKYSGKLDRKAGKVTGRWKIGKDWSGDFYVEIN